MLTALIQPQIIDSNVKENLSNLTKLCDNLIKDVDWIIFPEMFNTGFDFTVFNQADYESIIKKNSDDGLEFLCNLSVKYSCAVEGSLLMQNGNSFFNRHWFITDKGQKYYYDKQKLFSLSDEAKYLSAGDKESIVQYNGWKINMKTCYDVRFPEICRNNVIFNKNNPTYPIFKYDIMTFVASWPKSRIQQWLLLLQTRAIENMCYVIGVNRCGTDMSGIEYNGTSCVINCKGEILEPLPQSDNSVLYYNIEKDYLDKQRKKFQVYLDW